jgi:glycosyltransferase involved in cell wall biosynthesis
VSGPPRVHLVHQSFGDYVDGLLSGLRSLGPEAVDVRVTTISSGAATRSRLRSEPVDHRRLVVPRFRDPRSPIRSMGVVGRLLAEPCDVVHWQAAGNPWVDLAYLRHLLRRGRGTPSVVTVHDMTPHPGDATVLPGTFRVIHHLVRRADRVVVHAPHIRDQAIAIGAEPDRVRILAHGELGTRYLPADRLPLPPSDEPVVLFFGRAQGYKGLDLAAEAMPAVAAAVPGARLVVAGSGPSIDQVFPPDRALPPWCELHRGPVPDDLVPELYRRARVVVLPYREASQSGVAALAAGLGRPVVASRVPGLADIVEDGHSGLLVDAGSAPALAAALTRVLSDRDLADRLSAGAHRVATTTLSWPTIAAELVGLYGEIIDRRVGASHPGADPAGRRP